MRWTRLALSTFLLLGALSPAHASPASPLPVCPELTLDTLFPTAPPTLPADPLRSALPDACFFAGGSCQNCPDHTTAKPCRTLLCEGKKYTTCGTCQTDCVPPTS